MSNFRRVWVCGRWYSLTCPITQYIYVVFLLATQILFFFFLLASHFTSANRLWGTYICYSHDNASATRASDNKGIYRHQTNSLEILQIHVKWPKINRSSEFKSWLYGVKNAVKQEFHIVLAPSLIIIRPLREWISSFWGDFCWGSLSAFAFMIYRRRNEWNMLGSVPLLTKSGQANMS